MKKSDTRFSSKSTWENLSHLKTKWPSQGCQPEVGLLPTCWPCQAQLELWIKGSLVGSSILLFLLLWICDVFYMILSHLQTVWLHRARKQNSKVKFPVENDNHKHVPISHFKFKIIEVREMWQKRKSEIWSMRTLACRWRRPHGKWEKELNSSHNQWT